MRLRFLAGSCAVCALTAAACTSYTQHGETLYHEGRYIEAAEVFELTEAELSRCSATERAEFGMYRGLTFLRLDDLYSARQWLGYASALERRDPKVFDSYDQGLLDHGWAELERRSRAEPAVGAKGTRVATTDSSGANGASGTASGAARGTVSASNGNGRRSVSSP